MFAVAIYRRGCAQTLAVGCCAVPDVQPGRLSRSSMASSGKSFSWEEAWSRYATWQAFRNVSLNFLDSLMKCLMKCPPG